MSRGLEILIFQEHESHGSSLGTGPYGGPLKKEGRALSREIPILGRVAAGKPTLAVEHVEGTIPLPTEWVKGKEIFLLKVKGDSMIDMGILSGDVVLIRHQLTANQGDIVVAITEKGATLKIYKIKNGKPILEARNKNFPQIEPKELEIRGKFVGLLRGSTQYS